MNQDPEGVRPLVTDPRFLIGLSDGGAHVDQLCDAGYATYLLGKWVRERQALTLEEGVRRLTSEVATFFGVPDRGVIAPGRVADLVLFDPETVDDVPPEYVTTCREGGSDWSPGRGASMPLWWAGRCCTGTAPIPGPGPVPCCVNGADQPRRNGPTPEGTAGPGQGLTRRRYRR
jgi:hypothetical protein